MNSVTSSLGCRAHTLERNTFINENLGDEQFAVFSATVILLFPVGNGRAEYLLNICGSCLLGETESTEGAIHLHAAYHVYYVAHLAG